MEELLRKKFKLEIEFFGRFRKPKVMQFEFYQGTLRELLEMKSKISDPKELDNWLADFLMSKVKGRDKLTMNLYWQLTTRRKNDIIQFLVKTFGKNFFVKSESQDRSPASAMICFVLEFTNETIESLLEMTWEQIEFIIEGVVWNINAKDPKGREKNDRMMRMRELKEKFTDTDTDEKLARIEEKMKSKKLKK